MAPAVPTLKRHHESLASSSASVLQLTLPLTTTIKAHTQELYIRLPTRTRLPRVNQARWVVKVRLRSRSFEVYPALTLFFLVDFVFGHFRYTFHSKPTAISLVHLLYCVPGYDVHHCDILGSSITTRACSLNRGTLPSSTWPEQQSHTT